MTAAPPRDLFVVGVQRCGTTALHAILDEHPQVEMARPVRPEPKTLLTATFDVMERQRREARLFTDGGAGIRIHGEKSTSYLDCDVALKRIRRWFPTSIVIVVLRDPVERAISHYRFSVANGLEPAPADEVLGHPATDDRPWNRDRTSVSPFAYHARSRYEERLRVLDEVLAGHQVEIVVGEELFSSPGAVSSLHLRLGLDPMADPVARHRRWNAGEVHRPVSERSRQMLHRHLTPTVQAVERRLGRSLPWTRSE